MLEPELAKRLEALTGEDAACCAGALLDDAERARADPAFDRLLGRAKALADERRLLALALLKRRGELCACEIQVALGLTHATVSHHMGVLRGAGLVAARREGKWTHYALATDARELVP